jgi:hypothetical protein
MIPNPPRPTNTLTHRVERAGGLYVYIPIKPVKP